jgi:hypothetical protein
MPANSDLRTRAGASRPQADRPSTAGLWAAWKGLRELGFQQPGRFSSQAGTRGWPATLMSIGPTGRGRTDEEKVESNYLPCRRPSRVRACLDTD